MMDLGSLLMAFFFALTIVIFGAMLLFGFLTFLDIDPVAVAVASIITIALTIFIYDTMEKPESVPCTAPCECVCPEEEP